MALLGLPAPADLIRLISSSYAAIEQALALVPRAVALLGQVEAVLSRVSAVIDGVDRITARAIATVDRVDRVIAGAESSSRRVNLVLEDIKHLAERARGLVDSAQPLLETFVPVLDRIAPTAQRLAETTSPAEVDAVIVLINALPTIVDKLDSDILPVLDTLSTVAPDLRDLLDVSKELNELIGSIPGLGRVKRRIEEQQEIQDREYRADEEPANSPHRRASTELGAPETDGERGNENPPIVSR
jgi:hypothetical protein